MPAAPCYELTRVRHITGLDGIVRDFSNNVDANTPAVEVLRHAARTVAAAVPADYWCGVLLDPSTLLDTGGTYERSFPESVMPRLFEIEHVEHVGANNLRALARRGASVSVLSEATRGDLENDVYHRDILRPLGMADEMRVLLRQGTNTWGLLVSARGGPAGFSDREIRLAQALCKPAANALRSSLLLSGDDDGELPDAPGLLVLDEDHTVISSTPTARRWLDELHEEHRGNRRLPNAVHALAKHASSALAGSPARSVARTRKGRWVSLHGWAMDGPRTAVAVGPAGVTELMAVILAAYNLTARERDVAQHVFRGRTTSQIARALGLSPYTVQDHLQAIFRKVDVGSCRELMSVIFARHYLPRLGPGRIPPLSTDGRMYGDDTDGPAARTA